MQVQERLLKGWSYKRIAADMRISAGTVDTHARHIYKQHRVHGRWELIAALGVTGPRPMTKREQVRVRLAGGESYKQIAAAMGLTYSSVKGHARLIRVRGTETTRAAPVRPMAPVQIAAREPSRAAR